MARTTAAKTQPVPDNTPQDLDPRLKGHVVFRPLESVRANDWNPNHFTDFQKASLRKGLEQDGWLVSQSLLIWGTDEKGAKKNIIIDGEHRWTEATALGFKQGPMVFLERLPEKKAKALTIKLGTKRGQHDDVELGELLREIQFDLDGENMALDIGIENENLMMLLADPEVEMEGEGRDRPDAGVIGDLPGGKMSQVKQVQMFFTPEQHEEYTRLTKDLAVRFKLNNGTDVVMEALRRAHAAKK